MLNHERKGIFKILIRTVWFKEITVENKGIYLF